MPVEAHLTRQLDIRFIDARTLCTEAKVSLGVEGYPTEDQEGMLIQEAVQIFERRPNEAKTTMRRLKSSLDAVTKSPMGSSFKTCESSDSEQDGSEFSQRSRRAKRRSNKFWSIRRRQARGGEADSAGGVSESS